MATEATLRRLERGGWFLEARTWVRGPWYSATTLGQWAKDNDVHVVNGTQTQEAST